jgi:hypothetical protein
MNAMRPAVRSVPASPAATSVPLVGALRVLLLGEAALGLAVTILLSMLAADAERSTEESIRFAAGGTFIFAIAAAVAARGARRRRAWAWTWSAVLQLVLAIGTGLAVIVATWHPVYLAGFALAAAVMLVLSSASVRRALGQE